MAATPARGKLPFTGPSADSGFVADPTHLSQSGFKPAPFPQSGGARAGILCGILSALAVAMAGAALHLSLQTFRPPVWVDATPKSPAGYFFGGAVYQGSGVWITNKPALPSARSDLTAVSVANKVR
jgi:hypothetical protein